MSVTDHDENYYYTFVDGRLYLGGSNISENGNGAFNKEIVEAILPSKYQNTLIYGTRYRCLSGLAYLKKIFIPRTYREIREDFCKFSYNVEFIEFEENSELEELSGYTAHLTSIKSFSIPSSVKILSLKSAFYGCKNIETIYYAGKLACSETDAFTKANMSALKVFTRVDYAYDSFCGAKVVKILNKPKKLFTCKRKQERFMLRYSFLIYLVL